MVYSSLFPRNSIKNLVVSKIQILFKSSYYFSKFHLSASAKDSHHEVEEAIFVPSEQVLDASAKESIQHAATKVTNIASSTSWWRLFKQINEIIKSVYLIATRDLSNLWLQFFLSQNQGFMRLFEKTVLK